MNEMDQLKQANRRAAFIWGTGVVAFLALQLVLGFSAIALSKSDPTVAIVPDYYQKSLDWDERKRLRLASDELGWTVQTYQDGHQGLTIEIIDRDDVPVEIDQATVSYFRHARAGELHRRSFNDITDGLLTVTDSFDHEGLWTIEIDLVDGHGTRFVRSFDDTIRPTETNR